MKELERENGRLKRAVADLTLDKLILEEAARETSEPERRRRCVVRVRQQLGASERRACRVLGSHARPSAGRGKWRVTRGLSEVISCDSRVDSAATATDAATDMLRIEGWGVNHKRVERIWSRRG